MKKAQTINYVHISWPVIIKFHSKKWNFTAKQNCQKLLYEWPLRFKSCATLIFHPLRRLIEYIVNRRFLRSIRSGKVGQGRKGREREKKISVRSTTEFEPLKSNRFRCSLSKQASKQQSHENQESRVTYAPTLYTCMHTYTLWPYISLCSRRPGRERG